MILCRFAHKNDICFYRPALRRKRYGVLQPSLCKGVWPSQADGRIFSQTTLSLCLTANPAPFKGSCLRGYKNTGGRKYKPSRMYLLPAY